MLKPLALETRYDITAIVRMPIYAVMLLAFPVVFYLLFGVALSGTRATGGRDIATPMLASYAAFGVIGAALFRFGMGVSMERAQGWLLVKRASPMPSWVYVLGKMGSSLALCAAVIVSLELCAGLFGGVRLAPSQWSGLAAALLLGVVPFCAIALAIGFAVGPNSAPAVINLIHLPGAFLGGLWVPIEILPSFVRAIAPWLPHYHLGQLALAMIGQPTRVAPLTSTGALVAWTIIGAVLAVLAIRRDDGRLYG